MPHRLQPEEIIKLIFTPQYSELIESFRTDYSGKEIKKLSSRFFDVCDNENVCAILVALYDVTSSLFYCSDQESMDVK